MTDYISVVTGAAGFIGSHLVDKLLSEGHCVIGVDNLLTGSLSNIENHKNNSNFKYIEQDVSKHIEIEGDVHFVFHFASPASPRDYLQYPIQTMKVGSLGTLNMLGLAKKKNAVFLLASTSECYGDPLVHPQTEEYYGNVNPVGPRSVYDEAKRFAEALTMSYNRFHNVDTKIVRIFNTYGPRMRINDGRVIPTFISQILENKPLTVFGNGKQTRSFCFVSDLVDGIYRLSKLNNYHYPINIGNPNEITIFELAEIMSGMENIPLEVIYEELPQDDPLRRKPDITKATSLLSWHPCIDIKTGLRKTIDYFS